MCARFDADGQFVEQLPALALAKRRAVLRGERVGPFSLVLDLATDAELYRSPADIPVRLGV